MRTLMSIVRMKNLGMATGALILAGMLPGCATYQKCGFAGCPNDAQITADVETRLSHHPELQPPDLLYVKTVDNVVYLSGTVSTGLHSVIAESVAHHNSDVTRVVNNIDISK